MKLSFIIISSLIILLAIDLRVKVYLSYDLIKNWGNIKIKLFGITIFNSKISLIGNYFNFIRDNKKVIQIKINLDNNNLKFLKKVLSYYKRKIFVLSLFTDVYLSGTNPYLTTIMGGTLRSAGGNLDSYLQAKNQFTEIKTNVLLGYSANYLEFEIYSHVLLNLFDFIWSVITVIFRKGVKKHEKTK